MIEGRAMSKHGQAKLAAVHGSFNSAKCPTSRVSLEAQSKDVRGDEVDV
jgi:hypothetical protein